MHVTPPRWRGLRPWTKHSLVLALGGLVYIAIGWNFLSQPLTPSQRGGLTLALNASRGHAWPWASAFIVAGLLSLVSTRWPPASKTWGYTALSGVAAMWAAFYLVAVALIHADHVTWNGTLAWGLIALLWYGISGLVDPNEVVHHDAGAP